MKDKIVFYIIAALIIFGIYSVAWRLEAFNRQTGFIVEHYFTDYNENKIYLNDSLLNIANRKFWTSKRTACVLLVKTENGGAEWEFNSLDALILWAKKQ